MKNSALQNSEIKLITDALYSEAQRYDDLAENYLVAGNTNKNNNKFYVNKASKLRVLAQLIGNKNVSNNHSKLKNDNSVPFDPSVVMVLTPINPQQQTEEIVDSQQENNDHPCIIVPNNNNKQSFIGLAVRTPTQYSMSTKIIRSLCKSNK